MMAISFMTMKMVVVMMKMVMVMGMAMMSMLVMGMTMMLLMQIRLPWQMGIFSPRLSKRTAAAPKEDDNKDLEVKSSTPQYFMR